jgi:hypothetical protein
MASIVRSKWRAALVAALVLVAAIPAAASATATKPVIVGTEAGYFGSATVTHQVSVFVYLTKGPRAGNHVTVCLGGVCKRAHGHNAKLAWYSASFNVRHGYRMWDPVKFTVTAANGTGSVHKTVTDSLLCMRNNGSTPQS